MDQLVLILLGSSFTLMECNKVMVQNTIPTSPSAFSMFGAPNLITFRPQSPNPVGILGQTCQLIDKPNLPYPEPVKSGIQFDGTPKYSQNSYICADYTFLEPYYKMESLVSFSWADHNFNMPDEEPGVERVIGMTADNKYTLSRSKYYDMKKKQFNPYTGNYVKRTGRRRSSRRSPKDKGTDKKDDKDEVKDVGETRKRRNRKEESKDAQPAEAQTEQPRRRRRTNPEDNKN